MKKFLTVLCMITCIFGLTACGTQKENMSFDKAEVESISQMVYQNVCMDNAADAAAQLQAMDEDELAQVEALFKQYNIKIKGDVLASALSSYVSAQEEIGTLSDVQKYDIIADKDSLDVKMLVKGEKHDAELEILFDDKMNVTSVVVNPQYSFAEKMEKAALNTLMGMGTVFCVLILISLIISCFTFIPKIQEAFSKKKEDAKAEAVDNTIAQIIEKEELSDDSELVAVIAAAIAASEGAASTDGFVVRSIKRANTKKWQNA
ncbi:MAG: OadG family protein [Lachnospiraceae bacterium]|nr:OadG family protein [Lachnospiraceae bacterium]